MKKIVSTLFAAVLLCATVALAAPMTLTGTLTDSMCTKGKHMIPGKSDAECIRECIKSGAKWVLVSESKVYNLQGDKTKFNDLAGKRVKVTGDAEGTNVTVKQIAAAN
jgi:hypothetical protein